jgi:CHAP domain
MAEQDEAIKIVVEVVDKFSKPLADLKKELDRLDDKGGDGAHKLKRNFDGLRESIVNVSQALNATLVPALRALGVGFAGVGATIAAAVTALKSFAGSTEVLSRLSRETGISIDRMKEFEAVGRRLGISSGEMRQGFREFSAEMHKSRQGIGEMDKELRGRGLWTFADQLRHTKTNAQAFELAMKELDKIRDPQHRRDFLKMLQLPPGLADANAKERERLIAEYRKMVGPTTKDDVAASDRFEKALWDMGNAWEKFTLRMSRDKTLDRLATSLTTIANAIGRIAGGITEFQEKERKLKNLLTPPKPADLPGGASWTLWQQFWEKWLGNKPETKPETEPKKMSLTGAEATEGARLIRASLGGDRPRPIPTATSTGATPSAGGGRMDEFKATIKEGTAEGIVEGLKKWALDMAGGTAGAPGGGGGGGGGVGNQAAGARVIRASLGPSGSGGDGSDGTTAGTPGDSKAVPSHILAEAQKVAASGGPGAVAAYMRQKGYPKSGAWCGEFAAAVVRGAGGTPPAHPEVASNWRNFGERVYGAPQPGDIAVRRGTKTGSTSPHGHVTIVEKYDPKTGRFIGIGGNQGRLRSEYGTKGPRGYDFYRSKPDASVATPERPPAPKPQSDTPRPPAVPRDRMMDAAARQSQVARIEGAASVRIDLAGFARDGARTGTGAGMFSEVELHRGSTLPLASESA